MSNGIKETGHGAYTDETAEYMHGQYRCFNKRDTFR